MKRAVSSPKKKLEELELALYRKEVEFTLIKEITEAINSNMPALSLFKMWEFILRFHFFLDRAVFLLKEPIGWSQVAGFGDNESARRFIRSSFIPSNEQMEITPQMAEKHPELNNFTGFLPIQHKTQNTALVLYGSFQKEPADMKAALDFIQTVSSMIAVASENKRMFKEQIKQEGLRHEMTLARDVQEHLLPRGVSAPMGIQPFSCYEPHGNVGGDYYDYWISPKGHFYFCVADVSGKGMGAALLMSHLQACLRILTRHENDVVRIIKEVNREIFRVTEGDRYATLFIARFDPGTRILEYVNAGHVAPYLLVDSQVELLGQGCTIVGALETPGSIQKGKKNIPAGSIILCFSDGLIEEEPGFEPVFTEEELKKWIVQHVNEPTEQIQKRLEARIAGHKRTLEQRDDITLLGVKFL